MEDFDYAAARALHETLWGLIKRNIVTDEDDAMIRASVPPGIYRHFKSTDDDPKYYAVMGVGRDVDDGNYRVSYCALYPPHDGDLAFRQLVGPNPATGVSDGFLMPVDRDGYLGPRFELVEPCPPIEMHHHRDKYRA